MSPDKRYRADLTLSVQEEGTGQHVVSFELAYDQLPYFGLVALEHALIEALGVMLGLGLKTTMDLGQQEILKHNPELAEKLRKVEAGVKVGA